VYGRFEEHEAVSDYRQLLRRGSVMRRLAVSQHSLWRQEITARARIDQLRVRTWSRGDQPGTVWAVLQDWSLTREEHEHFQQRRAWLRED
jgi:hypothetical protein